ncbi:ester cyclase [Dyadobacter subterraneus]|uniref:Ester cyclase n=1 Tax=Dyadobacter subterraneus TaxID=2773304 RepID=A0ABR9WA56_9BACT|nr:ester cyclase [Dyadobacter subterraneus]MBE9462359.1 ester cyclase [Dyadobacter subterraneus]
MEITERNKAVVLRFNKEVIEEGNLQSFEELMDKDFINHSAPEGADHGPAGMINFFNNILRPAFPDLKVIIHTQVAEDDLVTTRKSITGTHRGIIFGITPTGKEVSIDVIDIVKVRDRKYFEHWGLNTLPAVLAKLSE